MSFQVADLADEEVERLAQTIETSGYATVEGFIDPETLCDMQNFVADAVGRSQGEYTVFTGPDAVRGSAFAELGESAIFRRLIERIFEHGTGNSPPEQAFYQVLRCLTGKGSMRHSYLFHYDSYVVTALIAVQMPSEGMPGDLLMIPNTRRIRSRYLWNVVDKLILDNPLSQFIIRQVVRRGWLPVTRIRMVPGNAYFFWGYRSIHTNEACDPGKVRATALYHYANPHKDASLLTKRNAQRRGHFNHSQLANAQS